MSKMINREQAIQALAEGKIVSWEGFFEYKFNFEKMILEHSNEYDAGFASYDGYRIMKRVKGLLVTNKNQNSGFDLAEGKIIKLVKAMQSEKQAEVPFQKTESGNPSMKPLTQRAIKKLSEIFGVKDQPFRVQPIRLFRLGKYILPQKGTVEDLSEYFLDEEGSLYSKNDDTYFTLQGQVLTKLSDSARSKSGAVVNSLRAKSGNKVTISRRRLELMRLQGELEEVTMIPYDTGFVAQALTGQAG